MPRSEEAEIIYKKKRATKSVNVENWRSYWRDAGPIRFAQEYLFCPANIPPFPNWQELQEDAYCEGCKKIHPRFRSNGIPVHIVLSDNQKEVLNDVWKNKVELILISAGRGAGKTFTLAVWNCWRLVTRDYYEITTMGGSAKQSKLLQKYIDYWRGQHKEVGYIIHKSPKAIGNRACVTRMDSENTYIACSPTAAMGPHVNEVQIDEECAAESRGTEGMEAIEAIDWQITGRTDTIIWRTSTSHFIFGKFYEIMTNPSKEGYKVYIWSIANHISGKPNRTKYTDRNPNNWVQACWWITKKDIIKLRKKSDEEWLCWGLGYPSLASGQIFKQVDIKIITCDACEREGNDCIPYKWGHCKLIKMFNLGVMDMPTKNVIDLKSGFDYGDPAPCALIIGGTKMHKGKRWIFILYAEEQKGLETTALYEWVLNKLKIHRVQDFNPDPSIGGKHVSEKVDNAGYVVNILDEQAKEERVLNVKCIVERHNIVIPVAFWQLLSSLKMVHRGKNGKIKKHKDHSFDAFCYLCIDWGDLEGSAADMLNTLFEELGIPKDDGTGDRSILLTDQAKGINFWP